VRLVADAHYQRLCGDLEGALGPARAARVTAPGKLRSPWAFQAVAVETELLTELGRPEEVLGGARAALAECEREGMRHLARGLSCALSLAEGKSGDFAGAMARLESVIVEQKELGVTGLPLGKSYEYGARIALWSGNAEEFERLSALAAEQYRPGQSSVLGALYERLMEEARQAGIGVSAAVSPMGPVETRGSHSSSESVTSAMAECADRNTRAERALTLLCAGDPPGRGHLFYIGDDGLELVASNDAVNDLATLVAFAQSRIDAEAEPLHTMTAALPTAAMASVSLIWQAPDGTPFTTVLLAAPHDSAVIISGVLVLADSGARPRHFDDVAMAVARAALESGDARGMRAT
jgi:hypothetical protein